MFYVLIIIFFISPSLYSQNPYSKNLITKFKIKAITVYGIKPGILNSIINSKGTRCNFFRYDEKGNNIESINFDDNSFIQFKRYSEYDKNEILLKECFWIESNDKPTFIDTFLYGEGNLISKILSFNVKDNKLKNYTIYEYELNKLIRTIEFNPDESVKGITSYNYDTNGRVIEEFSMDSNNQPETKVSIKYTPDGREIEKTIYSGERILTSKITKYNKEGLITEEINNYGPSKIFIHKLVYEYYEDGKIKAALQKDRDGLTSYIYNYEYSFYK